MHANGLARYGWLAALFAIGALWMRVENTQLAPRAGAAPIGVEEKPTARPAVVAVMNTDGIWGNYRAYLDQLNEIQKEVKEFEAEVARETKAIQEMTEQYNLQPEGTEAKIQLQLKYNQMRLALQSRMELKAAEFQRRMTEIWHDRYQDIERAASQVARERKFDMVLLSESPEMKRDDKRSVLSVVNRNVVYCRQELDITKDVLDFLNGK